MKHIRLVSVLLLFAVTITGCSSNKMYKSNEKNNLKLNTVTSTTGFMKKINAYLHIYGIDSKCESDYLGTIDLDKPTIHTGLPINKLLYLDLVFVNSHSMGGPSSAIHTETLMTPKKGKHYEIEAHYEDSIYDVAIWEKRSKKSKKRKYKLIPYETCKDKLKR